MAKPFVNPLTINAHCVDLETGRVSRDDTLTQLPPRVLAVLRHFAANPGRVISRDELIESVWGHLDAASDDSVNVAVSSLRRALGDDRRPYRVIAAIPRRGYLFEPDSLASSPGERDGYPAATSSGDTGAASAPRRRDSDRLSPWRALRSVPVMLGSLGVLVMLGVWWLSPPGERQRSASVAPIGGGAIAVLPFVDMSPEGGHAYFGDGLADQVIHSLTQSPNFDVVARTSSFALRDSGLSIAEIAQRLAADIVLEGSVQVADQQVRVLAQLIDASDEKHIWSRVYVRAMEEIFLIQQEIAEDVARTMAGDELPQTPAPGVVSERLWSLLAQARSELNRFTVEGTEEAQRLYELALAEAPDNVEALLGVRSAIAIRRTQGPLRTKGDVFDVTSIYLERAADLAPNDSRVLGAVGDRHFGERRFDEALTAYRQAIGLNPSDSYAHGHLGRALYRLDRFEEALAHLQKAVVLDPYDVVARVNLADGLWALGRAEEAVFQLREIIHAQPLNPRAYDRLGNYLAQMGRTGEAMLYLQHQVGLDPKSGYRLSRVCEFYLTLGDLEAARGCLDQFERDFDHPNRLGYLRYREAYARGDLPAAREHVLAITTENASSLRNFLIHLEAVTMVMHGSCEAGLAQMREAMAPFFSEQPPVRVAFLAPVRATVRCLQETGEVGQAERLLAANRELIARLRVERGPFGVTGLERVWSLELAGQHEEAMQALQTLIAGGWTFFWWELLYDPAYQRLREAPGFAQLKPQLMANIQGQREFFERHRDEPLPEHQSGEPSPEAI